MKFSKRICQIFLLGTLSGHADVIYSNLLDAAIPLDFDGVTINIGSGQLNPFFGGVAVANNDALQPYRTGTGGLDTILNFSFGTSINGSTTALATGFGGSQDHLGATFTAGQEGYLGFKLNNANYGWARVVFTNNSAGAVVRDWAYDNSGAGIVVGGIRQVGQDIVLSSSFTVASSLADSGGSTNLTQTGSVTNSLTATNTYTGTTSVTGGTLSIDGSGSIDNSDVSLSGGTFRYNSSVTYTGAMTFTSGTLGGTNLNGALGGLEIGADQILSPGAGNGAGTAQTTSQIWAGGGTLDWGIRDAAGTVGVSAGWDLLTGSGSLSISATSSDPFTIAINSLGLGDVGGNATGFNSMLEHQWLLADFSSTISSFAADAFVVDDSGFTNAHAGIFGIALGDQVSGGDASQLYLTYLPVPEPNVVLLAAIGIPVLMRRRRTKASDECYE